MPASKFKVFLAVFATFVVVIALTIGGLLVFTLALGEILGSIVFGLIVFAFLAALIAWDVGA